MRLSYPPNLRIIRVPCTGKVDVIHILRAFEKGADGVAVVGCLEGDCHYLTGNLRARKRVEQAQKILDTVGVGGERVKMFNLSSGEGPRFAQYAQEIFATVMELGPNPVKLAKRKQQSGVGDQETEVSQIKAAAV
ncbi:MAG: hydrogenase iron-sulfur subunit [Desulfohalobiaceae bacterium]|nr:hydrogenase iron-sulfur subunit [Desulfohalobiaceae bacterium]